jgi:hypothetical protein
LDLGQYNQWLIADAWAALRHNRRLFAVGLR